MKKEKEKHMFSQQIEQLWEEWYQAEKPKKISNVIFIIPPICILLCIAGVVIMAKHSETIGLIVIICSFVFWIIIAFKVSGGQEKATQSAKAFCWSKGIYTVGKEIEFPFLHTNAQYIIGGRCFSYKNEKVTLYDTYYASQNNSPGIVIEIEPLYAIGDGIPKWKKGHVQIPDTLGLRGQCIKCIEQLMDYQYHHMSVPKCCRNGDKFYIYAAHTAMGLIVDESGMLYKKTASAPEGLWKGADCLLDIINECLDK